MSTEAENYELLINVALIGVIAWLFMLAAGNFGHEIDYWGALPVAFLLNFVRKTK